MTYLPTKTPTLQTIPPKSAQLCLRVETFMREELRMASLSENTLFVGFSGGPDSTALLLILHILSPRLGLSIHAAHLNHGIRPEADKEEIHCQSVCQWLGIPFTAKKVSVPECSQGKGLEETARQLRYSFFTDLQKKSEPAWVALGHQLEDLSEDVLMRLLRGAGWPALSGMSGKDEKRKVVRPLLLEKKLTLLHFLSALEVPYVVDTSNDENFCLRNRIRHEVMPVLLRENPSFQERMAELWRQGRDDETFFASMLPQDIPESFVPTSTLEPLAMPLRLRLLKKTLDKASIHPISSSLYALDKAWRNKKTGNIIQFPGGNAIIEKKGIRIIKSPKQDEHT